jgi:phage shock protein A
VALIKRMKTLLQADLHALLDRIEEPELLLRQALRDMEEACARDERHLQQLSHERMQLDKRKQALEETLETIRVRLDHCFAADNEELARRQIRQKLETEQLAQLLVLRMEELEQTGEEIRERIAQNSRRLEEIRQKAELLSTRCRLDGTQSLAGSEIRPDDVELAFLQEKQRRRLG